MASLPQSLMGAGLCRFGRALLIPDPEHSEQALHHFASPCMSGELAQPFALCKA